MIERERWICCVCLGSREPTTRPNEWRTMDARARVFMCPICFELPAYDRDWSPWEEWTAYCRADVQRPPGTEVVDREKLIVLFRGAVVFAVQYRRHPHAPGAPNDCQDLRFWWEWGAPGGNRARDYHARERADAGPIGEVYRWSSPTSEGAMRANAYPFLSSGLMCRLTPGANSAPDRVHGGRS